MSESIITVENLSKRYIIGHQRSKDDGFRHVIEDAVRAPLKWLRYRREQNKQQREEFWALKDVSFEVKQGEVLGIIGRNGAGKSTLLKILSRITEPTSGRIEIEGRVASLLEVGTGFHPELTGRENIFLNGAILGMSRVDIIRRFDEIVAFSEIERFLDTPVKRYSSGMYVRLAFAVAAHLEPEILIVDEVLAVGDARFQRKCLGKMQDVSSKDGRTVLFVSHNMAAVQELCSRVIVMRSGTVQFDGFPAGATSEYLGDASTSGNGWVDLTDHPSRSRSHKILISRLAMISADGTPTSRVFPDDEVRIEIEVNPEKIIREPRMALAIEDANGRRLFTVASYFSNNALPPISGPTMVSCFIGALNLGAGRYLLSVSIGDKSDGLLDSLDSAVWIEVDWKNNFGNGEPYYSVYGPMLRRSEWHLLQPASAEK